MNPKRKATDEAGKAGLSLKDVPQFSDLVQLTDLPRYPWTLNPKHKAEKGPTKPRLNPPNPDPKTDNKLAEHRRMQTRATSGLLSSGRLPTPWYHELFSRLAYHAYVPALWVVPWCDLRCQTLVYKLQRKQYDTGWGPLGYDLDVERL